MVPFRPSLYGQCVKLWDYGVPVRPAVCICLVQILGMAVSMLISFMPWALGE